MNNLTIAFTIFLVGTSSFLVFKTFLGFLKGNFRKKQPNAQHLVIGMRSVTEL